MTHYDVLIATPGNALLNGYVACLTDTLARLTEQRISWKWLNGSSSLAYAAREKTMSGDGTIDPTDTGPLHGQCTYKKMFWIDSDIVWTWDDFARLYESKYEVVCGAYLAADGFTSSVNAFGIQGGLSRDVVKQRTEPFQIESTGFGFVAVKSGVFEKMERPWFGHLPQWMSDGNGRVFLDSLGEDVSWCVRARDAGFAIYFDPRVLVTHMKTQAVKWGQL